MTDPSDYIRTPAALKSPETPDPFYNKMAVKRDKIRTVLEGTQAMRDAGEKYTPKFGEETDTDYKRRLQKTHLTNVTADSIENAVSKVFSKELAIDETNSFSEAVQWAENIDRQNSTLNDFGEESFYNVLADGTGYILADNPQENTGELSIEEKTTRNIRPYLVFIEAASMIAYRCEIRNNAKVPVYIRYIVEDFEFKADGTSVEVKTVHEISAAPNENEFGYFKTYRQEKGGEWIVTNEGAYPFDQVTCVRINFGKKHELKKDVITPPFLDLAETNIAHWNSSSDQNNVLEHSRFAMYHFKGVEMTTDENGDPISPGFGPTTVCYSKPNTDASIEAITLPVDGLIQGWTDLDRKINEMKMMGLDPLVPSDGGALTASERIIDENKANSALQNWAIRFNNALEKAFQYMALWDGLSDPTKIKLDINTEFGVTEKEVNEVKLLREMHFAGQLSLETLLDEIKNRKMFDTDFDTARELARIAAEQGANDFDLPDDASDPNMIDSEEHKGGVKFPRGTRAA